MTSPVAWWLCREWTGEGSETKAKRVIQGTMMRAWGSREDKQRVSQELDCWKL